ncbi:MAG: penicillin acylase family protein [Ilumatobacter sp.]|nr:penicillin acylase family protein [Ilumatobacter sp.]
MKNSTRTSRSIAMLLAGSLVVAACSGDDESSSTTVTSGDDTVSTTDAESSDDTTGDTTAPTTDATPPTTAETAPTTEPPAPAVTDDRAYYILPPGNYGGLPTNDDSLDQLALYDGLTPLRGDVTDADIESFYLPADFAPIGETTVEETGRDGLTIVYDEYGIPHITGETNDDVAFGAGWVAARDRALLIDLGRGAARVALADVPGIDAFSLVTSGQVFVPSEAAEQLVTDQVQLIIDTYGAEGAEIIAEAQAYADGMNAYWAANDLDKPPATVNDVIAVTAFIGSIFGAGGGGEAANAEFLAALRNRLGFEEGTAVWNDLLQTDDPEAPTTLEERFDYGTYTGGDVTGSIVLDEGSMISFDPREPAADSVPVIQGASFVYPATDGPITRTASNWLTVAPSASVNDTTLAVMGPQLGYYYPEIVQQIHLVGPDYEAQGAAVPGLSMYMLIGRTADYAWSLTSAGQDVRDVYVEVLCEPDGSTPTRTSGHYEFDGDCIAFEEFDAGTLGDVALRYPVSVHGPVIGTATVDGLPVALTSKRSTFGRDGLNLAALKGMTQGDAATPEDFFEVANRFGFTFNWGYANRETNAYFASGYLPVRAEGLDRRLPTLGTGNYEWQGYLELDEHPHAVSHPSSRLLNWNNQSAPGFMHGDNNLYGSVHRVEAFDQWPDEVDLAGVVSIMNRSATEDESSTLWPVVSEVLAGGEAPTELAAEVKEILDEWVADDAPLLDADDDGDYDQPGATIYPALLSPLYRAALDPVLGQVYADDVQFRGIGGPSIVDKDLRNLLGQDVEGPFEVQYCGAGDLDACRDALWGAVAAVADELAAEYGPDTSTWLVEGRRSTFTPGLIPDDFRATNRPTFQQVIEFAPR